MSKYKTHFTSKQFLISLTTGVALLLLSLVANFYAGLYASERASNYVNDIVLSNIPVFNVDLAFVYGPFIIWAIVAVFAFHQPKRLPFLLKSIALFVFTRSVFITLTHLGPFPDAIIIDYTSDFVKKFTFGADLFFSAHTGLPFLMALCFWQNLRLRIFFILAAIFFGVIVLLGHLHYSIDVLAAFYITYTIFHLARTFFKRDYEVFHHGLEKI